MQTIQHANPPAQPSSEQAALTGNKLRVPWRRLSERVMLEHVVLVAILNAALSHTLESHVTEAEVGASGFAMYSGPAAGGGARKHKME